MRRLQSFCITLCVAILQAAPFSYAQGAEKPTVVVTTSILGEAARDLLGEGEDAPASIVELAPPGACPGHFDLSPRLLPSLRAAELVVRHSYQAGLDGKMRSAAGEGVVVIVAPTSGTLLMPTRFAALQGDLARALCRVRPQWAEAIEAQVQSGKAELAALEREILEAARPLAGRSVLASAMQADFCRRLGVRVVGMIGRPEDLTPREVARLGAMRPDLVVANLQSGVRAAAALAERTGAPLVVLSNFPRAEGFGRTYADLVRENVERLVQACASR